MTRTSKPAWPTVGWGAWAAAAIAAVIILTCTLNSLRWVNRPFPGFLLWENLLVPAVGDTDWTGYKAGVPFQSRLTAVNGQAVTSAEEVYRMAADRPVGTSLIYTFVRDTGAAPLTRTVGTMRLTVQEYLWTLGNYLGVGLLLTLLGFTVYFLRPDTPAARAMLSAGVMCR